MDEARSLQYSISVTADTAQAENSIRGLTSSIGSLQGSGGRISVDADTSSAELGLRSLTGSIGGVQSQATSMGAAFRSSFLEGIDSGNSFGSSLKSGVGGAFSYVGSKASEFGNNVVSTAQSIKQGFTHPIETIKSGLGNALQTAKDRFVDMARGADKAAAGTDEMADAASDAEKEVKDLGDAADSSGGKFEKFGTIMKGVGAALAAGTAAVTAFAASSVNVGMTFDSSMSQVAATMGYSVEELNTAGSEANETYNQLRNFAMEMGASTAFSASEAADALNYMALAGYDADTSMAMLPNVLNLAAAGGIELAAASDMVTDAQSALGLSLDETSELVDKMAMASSKSNTSVEQLGNAILAIGGTAQNLAGGTTELSAALGILADNGIKGAEGGTHLRNIILSLASPSDTAATAMKKLGLEVFDAAGNMRPLNEVFGDLQDTLSTMSQGEQLDAIGDIFNTTDIASVTALLGTNAERWEELTGYIDDAAGAAGDMAETQLDNLAGDITLFKSALEGAQIVVSDQLTPTLREFVQFGSGAVSTLATAFQESGLSGAMSALGGILSDAVAMIIDMLPTLIDAGMQLIGALGQGLLDNIPTLVSAAAEIVVMLASGIGNALPELVPSIIETLIVVGETILENLPLILEAGMSIVSGLAEGLLEALPLLIEALPNLITGILDFVSESLPTILEQGSTILMSLAEGILTAIPMLVEQLPALITSITTFAAENMPTIVSTGIELVIQLAGGIIAAIPQLVEQLPQIISAIVGGISALLGSIVDVGKNIVQGLWDGICAMGDWIKEKVSGFFSGIVDGVKGLLGIHSPSKVFASIGDNMALGLGEGFENTMGGVTKDIENAIPTEIDGPEIDIPDPDFPTSGGALATVSDVAYQVHGIVDDVNTPAVSDVTYGVTPIVSDFNPPDTSADNPNGAGTPDGESDPETSGGGGNPAPFAPVIYITVEGNADEGTIENMKTSLRDTVKELFNEFREEELERQTLKNQYAF